MLVKDVEIPKIMRTMERDRRGFPIPFIVMRSPDGKPIFPVNDARRVDLCIRKKLCGITGKPLIKGEYWFVGGPKSCLHPHGAFLDPPVCREAAEYAMRVCPYLVSRAYNRLDERGVGPLAGNAVVVTNDYVDSEGRPSLFGLVMTNSYSVIDRAPNTLLKPDPWVSLEWWRRGERVEITPAERAEALLA